ncbi:MAG: hypothetical protein KME06_17160 [Kastovskya adunca ATA6-11-RM4]|jgi:hypothetical protein|nr:hypothetical protein [Kastovskya adunca ATA6-11-RM4]
MVMSVTTVHAVVGIHNFILVVFYTGQTQVWQFRVVSAGGAVFGEQKIYFSAEAALKAGREWIEAGN